MWEEQWDSLQMSVAESKCHCVLRLGGKRVSLSVADTTAAGRQSPMLLSELPSGYCEVWKTASSSQMVVADGGMFIQCLQDIHGLPKARFQAVTVVECL